MESIQKWFASGLILILMLHLSVATEYNGNYTGNITSPKWGKNIPFLFYKMSFWMNDAKHSSSECYLISCKLHIAYSSHTQTIAQKDYFFRESACGGRNNYTIIVPTVVDFEDPAGQWHKERFAIERLNLSCVNQNDDEGFYALDEISAVPLPWFVYVMVFFSLAVVVLALVFALYSRYGLLAALLSFTFVFLTYLSLAVWGFTDTLWIEHLYSQILFIIAVVTIVIALLDYIFNDKEETLLVKLENE